MTFLFDLRASLIILIALHIVWNAPSGVFFVFSIFSRLVVSFFIKYSGRIGGCDKQMEFNKILLLMRRLLGWFSYLRATLILSISALFRKSISSKFSRSTRSSGRCVGETIPKETFRLLVQIRLLMIYN